MNVVGLLAGTAVAAIGAVGWSIAAGVNGNPLARTKVAVDTPSGFETTATGEAAPFSYEGKVDHTGGFKRRILAIFGLILVIGVVGAAIAGALWLIVDLIISAISKYVAGG